VRKFIIAALFTLTLAGCATTSQYGNFVPTAANQQQIATDAVQQLVTLYLPAKTRFELHQVTPDAFGLALVNTLRERGYALLEFSPADQAEASAAAAVTVAAAPTEALAALPLRYVLDQAGATNLYRLTLLIGNQSLTRLYLEENGSFVPAGYWTRKE
jgi:hypothetical protein